MLNFTNEGSNSFVFSQMVMMPLTPPKPLILVADRLFVALNTSNYHNEKTFYRFSVFVLKNGQKTKPDFLISYAKSK